MAGHTTFCVDISESMSSDMVNSAIQDVYDKYENDDKVIIFNRYIAKILCFQDLASFKFGVLKSIDLRKELFIEGTNCKWEKFDGAYQAFNKCIYNCSKIIYTDTKIPKDDMELFNLIYVVSKDGKIILA